VFSDEASKRRLAIDVVENVVYAQLECSQAGEMTKTNEEL
jgi:hypothetical protein